MPELGGHSEYTRDDRQEITSGVNAPLVPLQRANVNQVTGNIVHTNTRPARTHDGHPGA